jgi:tetrahydromethanopterin S-methyltransferase subunit E
MPVLVRFLLLHCAVGCVAGWLFLAALVLLDVGGVATRLFSSAAPAVPLVMLVLMFAVTFGSAAMGTGVMLLSRETRPPACRRVSAAMPALLPARAAIRAPRR